MDIKSQDRLVRDYKLLQKDFCINPFPNGKF